MHYVPSMHKGSTLGLASAGTPAYRVLTERGGGGGVHIRVDDAQKLLSCRKWSTGVQTGMFCCTGSPASPCLSLMQSCHLREARAKKT